MSIVIPAYNAEKTIAECLTAVQNQDWDGELETIVVNDGSTDNTAKIASAFPRVEVINTPNAGAPRATNIGIQRAHNDIVVLVDSDAVLEPNWLQEIMPWFGDANVATATGDILPANKGLLGRLMGLHSKVHRDRYSSAYVDQVGTTDTAYRRQALIEVGMFDERMKIGYDVDISRRLKAAGYQLVLARSAVCKHYWKDDLKSYCRQQYGFAYYRLELTRRFKKPYDQRASLGTILQVPFTILVTFVAVLGSLFLSPLALLALVLLPLIHIRDAASILLKKKDVTVALTLPFLFTLRNFVWIYAAMIWGVRRALGKGFLRSSKSS